DRPDLRLVGRRRTGVLGGARRPAGKGDRHDQKEARSGHGQVPGVGYGEGAGEESSPGAAKTSEVTGRIPVPDVRLETAVPWFGGGSTLRAAAQAISSMRLSFS